MNRQRIKADNLNRSLLNKLVTINSVYYGKVTGINNQLQIRVTWYRVFNDECIKKDDWVNIEAHQVYLYEKEKKQPNNVFDF